jgi:hypothetical protein
VKLANAEDEATSDGFDVFRYRKPLRRRGLIKVPRDKAADSKEVVTLLARKNADISVGDATAESKVKKVLGNCPRHRIRRCRFPLRCTPR